MLNAYSQSTIKPLHSFFPRTCWVRQVLTLAINNVAQKEEASTWRWHEDVLEFLAYATPSRLPVMFGVFVSRIKRKSMIIFLFLLWYCFCIHLYVTICMKLDPGMHIGMHLVSFGKSGVTRSNSNHIVPPRVWSLQHQMIRRGVGV
jgi:hypothetical protein